MKKVFILILSLTAVFVSCDKIQIEKIEENTTFTEKGLLDESKPTVCCYDYETNYVANGSKYCCEKGHGCAPCAVIVDPGGGEVKGSNQLDMVTDLLGENPEEVVAFFKNEANFKEVFPLLAGSDIHNKLCSGDYVMSNIIQAYRSNNRVFEFRNINDNSLIAVPYAEE